jgi:hypothetical protein
MHWTLGCIPDPTDRESHMHSAEWQFIVHMPVDLSNRDTQLAYRD